VKVDVEVAERVALELGFGLLVSFNLWQSADPVALQTAVQRGTRQVRDGGLKGIKAVIERQQRVPTEGDDHGLVFGRQHR
jgi:hypothetical protein